MIWLFKARSSITGLRSSKQSFYSLLSFCSWKKICIPSSIPLFLFIAFLFLIPLTWILESSLYNSSLGCRKRKWDRFLYSWIWKSVSEKCAQCIYRPYIQGEAVKWVERTLGPTVLMEEAGSPWAWRLETVWKHRRKVQVTDTTAMLSPLTYNVE